MYVGEVCVYRLLVLQSCIDNCFGNESDISSVSVGSNFTYSSHLCSNSLALIVSKVRCCI